MKHLDLPLLPAASQDAWIAYLREENKVPRQQMLASLDTFVEGAALIDEQVRDAWALALAESILGGGAQVTLRRRLLDALVLPALVRGFQAGSPRQTKWLSVLAQELFRNRSLAEQLGFPSEVELPRTAPRPAHRTVSLRHA